MNVQHPGADLVRDPGHVAAPPSGEEVAFEQLYRRTCGAAGGSGAADAADLLAQVYLVAWRRRDVLPPADQQRPWLYGIARLVLAEHHRRTPAHLPLDEVAQHGGGPGAVGGGDDVPGGSARAVALHRALAELGEVDRELLLLTVWDGLTGSEAARALGISSGAARVRLHRARRRLGGHPGLRALLDEPEPADPRPVVARDSAHRTGYR
ncbi:RNA polymerase sigma factor [Kineococcus glutinatus]|uniref:RNA polymerase sigma factor 70 region 4 type 2 domain-containing protein n=1 Tax=Kineococcus glutinatus TaxID=1070872 RepID=A0ABP9H9L4_9ACTN